jgi:hypothetical protein
MDNFEHREKPPPTKEEREAKKEQARLAAEKNLIERKKSDHAFRGNFERLKAERLARGKINAYRVKSLGGGSTPCDSEGSQLRLW